MDTPHPLKLYRDKHKLTPTAFARAVGTTRATVWKWEQGGMPRRSHCETIMKLTGGEITANHFIMADSRKPTPPKQEGSVAA